MTIQELLLKRFATKKFDSAKQVSEADLLYILECARLSCSLSNTQPWLISVVTNQEIRAKLREVSFGQAQVTDASHLLVISTVNDPMIRVNRTVDLIAEKGNATSAENYKKMAMGVLAGTPEQTFLRMSQQVHLALQAMILAATERGIDSCPMGGFLPQKYAEILGMTDAVPTCLLAIGYASEAGHGKIRVPMEDIVRRVS